MESVKKMARSQSIRVTELLRPSVVERPVIEEEVKEDSEAPTTLPILRVAGREGTKQQRRERERENRGAVGSREAASGKICYSDILHLLTCPGCTRLVTPPVSQCRRGHVYCQECQSASPFCLICKQPWLETPSVVLDKIIGLIALPCKYGPQGCGVITFQSERLSHQTVCQFRPVHCQFSGLGCEVLLAVKDMPWHHKNCTYAQIQEVNSNDSEIPDMPTRKKSSMKNGNK